MDADGSNQQQLTHHNDSSPAWSPDGAQIAFRSLSLGDYVDGTFTGDGFEGIFVMDAGGRNKQQLTFNEDRSPSWSPDGSQIAFTSMPDWKSANRRKKAADDLVGYLTQKNYQR